MNGDCRPSNRIYRRTQGLAPISEERPNAAVCFAPRQPAPEAVTPPDFTGVILIERAGKHWINLSRRLDCNGREFFAVRLKPVLPKTQSTRVPAISKKPALEKKAGSNEPQ